MEKLTGVTEFMSSAHYQVQKDIIFREINSLNAPRGFALPRFCEPGRLNTPDTAVDNRAVLDNPTAGRPFHTPPAGPPLPGRDRGTRHEHVRTAAAMWYVHGQTLRTIRPVYPAAAR